MRIKKLLEFYEAKVGFYFFFFSQNVIKYWALSRELEYLVPTFGSKQKSLLPNFVKDVKSNVCVPIYF